MSVTNAIIMFLLNIRVVNVRLLKGYLDTLDVDGDGYISVEEIIEGVKNFGRK